MTLSTLQRGLNREGIKSGDILTNGKRLVRVKVIGGTGARPLLEQIKSSIETARIDALPKSALAKACNYTLTLWQRLTRFLDCPVLELSNNLAENAIRPIALGRNYEQSGIRQSLAWAKPAFVDWP
jgi:hypothetical protein